ncbi:MAG: hypothetical protein ACHQ4F_03775 [Candidatus Dormibacteria bacterium]
MWLLLVYWLLIIEIQYPANTHGALGSLSIAGNTIDLRLVPLPLLLDASWVFLAAFILKYCQTAKSVERQYDYLHMLENRISDTLGDDEVYRREGRAYLSKYPSLLNWASICYTILFPAALIVGASYLYLVEVTQLKYDWKSELFDGLFFASIIVSLVLYRFLPRRTTKDAPIQPNDVPAE